MTNEYRAKASDLCMSEAMPFQQQFQYRTTLPLKDVVHEKFFLPVAANLRAGDQIRMVSYDRPAGGSVLELVDVIVIEKKPDAVVVVPLEEARAIEPRRDEKEDAPVTPRDRYVSGDASAVWNVGKRAYDIKISGEVVATEADADKARRMARGDIPLPEAVI